VPCLNKLLNLQGHLMSKTVNAVRRAVKAGIKAASGAPSGHKYQAGGKTVVCTHCSSDGFQRYGPLGATFGGYGLECSHCSHIEYFGKRPQEVEYGASRWKEGTTTIRSA
jgi:hypothetical protein